MGRRPKLKTEEELAPFGRDQNGEPLAPFGRKRDGTPRMRSGPKAKDEKELTEEERREKIAREALEAKLRADEEAQPSIKIGLNWVPWPFQLEVYQQIQGKKRIVAVCHRRFGKTHLSCAYVVARALANPLHRPVYWFVAPTIAQARDAAWPVFKELLEHFTWDEGKSSLVKYNNQLLRIEISRPWIGPKDVATIMLRTEGDDPDNLRGATLDGLVVDEYADMQERTLSEVLTPMVETPGREGWIMVISTAKGRNQLYDLFMEWKNKQLTQEQSDETSDYVALYYPASVTNMFSEEKLRDLQKDMGDKHFRQEYELDWDVATKDAYYARQLDLAFEEGRAGRSYPWRQDWPVHTAWDLGLNDATAIWFWQIDKSNGKVYLIDYTEDRQVTLPEWCRRVQLYPYQYGKHFGPWDLGVRELGTGKTREQIALEFNIRFTKIARDRVDNGIERVRMALPRMHFNWDKIGVQKAVGMLQNYMPSYNALTGAYGDKPRKGPQNHCADSLRYLVYGLAKLNSPLDNTERPKRAVTEYNEFRTWS